MMRLVGRYLWWEAVSHWSICLDDATEWSLACLATAPQLLEEGSLKHSMTGMADETTIAPHATKYSCDTAGGRGLCRGTAEA